MQVHLLLLLLLLLLPSRIRPHSHRRTEPNRTEQNRTDSICKTNLRYKLQRFTSHTKVCWVNSIKSNRRGSAWDVNEALDLLVCSIYSWSARHFFRRRISLSLICLKRRNCLGMRYLRFSQRWSFKTRYSGWWHSVVLRQDALSWTHQGPPKHYTSPQARRPRMSCSCAFHSLWNIHLFLCK
jgi:hypothetical protein